MPDSTNLTAIVLCKNAESTLSHCLASLDFCEHIIVGDDGSIDESLLIARKFHADIIKISPGLDFAQKRNYLLEYAKNEWVFYVDADEIVTSQLATNIQNQIRTTDAKGFYVRRMDVLFGKKLQYGETAHTWLLRVARRNSGHWKRPVHEIWQVSGKLDRLEGELLHYSHPDLEEFMDKINTYTDSETQERVKNHISKTSAYIQLFLFPVGKFMQNYIVRLGFLDGFSGFVMAWMMSLHSLCVRIKIIEKIA
ncbi:MAG: glycosyltransferase family 2 protein [Candidatus Woesebacteria bacterium]